MDYFSWLAQEEEFSDAALTVRAQNLPPLEEDRLLHDVFYANRDVDSMKLSQLTTHEFRPVADRREWNTRGRLLPRETPVQEELEFIPIESYFKIEEKEINDLLTRTLGDSGVIRRIIGSDFPARVDQLVNANRRRIEWDALQAWHSGTVTVMNPQLGHAQTVAYGFDPDRYQTAGTAWSDAGVNAYEEFLAWLEEGADVVPGGVIGVVLRRNDYRVIHADAPRGLGDLPLSRGQFEAQLAEDAGFEVRFFVLETWHDVFVGGGLSTERRRIWKPGTIAAVPAGIRIGDIARAPVARAFELARQEQDAQIDIRGMSIFKEIAGNGRELTTECQINSFPVPDEQRLWVMNTGVAAPTTA
jgi:hypothetical protein